MNIMSDNERAEWLRIQTENAQNTGYLYNQEMIENAFPARVLRARSINPRTKLKPLAARLLAVSNALWRRPDSLRRVKGEI